MTEPPCFDHCSRRQPRVASRERVSVADWQQLGLGARHTAARRSIHFRTRRISKCRNSESNFLARLECNWALHVRLKSTSVCAGVVRLGACSSEGSFKKVAGSGHCWWLCCRDSCVGIGVILCHSTSYLCQHFSPFFVVTSFFL